MPKVSGPPSTRNFAISGMSANTALAPKPNNAARISTERSAGDIHT